LTLEKLLCELILAVYSINFYSLLNHCEFVSKTLGLRLGLRLEDVDLQHILALRGHSWAISHPSYDVTMGHLQGHPHGVPHCFCDVIVMDNFKAHSHRMYHFFCDVIVGGAPLGNIGAESCIVRVTSSQGTPLGNLALFL